MAEIARKTGALGGKTAAKNMTAAERSARAKKASLAAAKKRTKERIAREAKRKWFAAEISAVLDWWGDPKPK
jgi:hypothetical protein